ncbi:hypothetical protein PR048_010302, partial [Dryococelus australis]
MLEHLLHLQEYIAAELASSNFTVYSCDSQEWLLIEGLVEILRPIAQATSDLSGNKSCKRRSNGIGSPIQGYSSECFGTLQCNNAHQKGGEEVAGLGGTRNLVQETTTEDDTQEFSLWSAVQQAEKPLSYLESPLLNRKENVYNWYKTLGCHSYHNIARITTKSLPIPATSVASESLFSAAGNTLLEEHSLARNMWNN